jgi:hypothetical protein
MIAGRVMTKSGRRLPGGLPVTGLAFRAELLTMLVCMAPEAGRGKPQQGALHVNIRFRSHKIGGDEFGLVARTALQLGMTALKFVSCLDVVELIHAIRPVNQFKVAPHVLAVALHAGLIHLGVVALAALQALIQVIVAGQAFVLTGSPSQFMALGAVGEALQ